MFVSVKKTNRALRALGSCGSTPPIDTKTSLSCLVPRAHASPCPGFQPISNAAADLSLAANSLEAQCESGPLHSYTLYTQSTPQEIVLGV